MRWEIELCSFLLLSWGLVEFCYAEPSVVDVVPAQNTTPAYNNDVEHYLSSLEVTPLTKNLNEIVDLLIQVAQETIRESGYASIHIPDINEEFTKKIKHFIKIKGKFKGEKGWFKDLSSIHRTSDAMLIHSGANLSVSVGLGLATMELGFDHYEAKVMHIRVKGKIHAKVSSNSVALKVDVEVLETGKCNLILRELKVTKFDGLKVEVTGLKPLNWLLSKITTSIARHMEKKIIHQVEQHLSEAAQKALDKYHCEGDANPFVHLQ